MEEVSVWILSTFPKQVRQPSRELCVPVCTEWGEGEQRDGRRVTVTLGSTYHQQVGALLGEQL